MIDRNRIVPLQFQYRSRICKSSSLQTCFFRSSLTILRSDVFGSLRKYFPSTIINNRNTFLFIHSRGRRDAPRLGPVSSRTNVSITKLVDNSFKTRYFFHSTLCTKNLIIRIKPWRDRFNRKISTSSLISFIISRLLHVQSWNSTIRQPTCCPMHDGKRNERKQQSLRGERGHRETVGEFHFQNRLGSIPRRRTKKRRQISICFVVSRGERGQRTSTEWKREKERQRVVCVCVRKRETWPRSWPEGGVGEKKGHYLRTGQCHYPSSIWIFSSRNND